MQADHMNNIIVWFGENVLNRTRDRCLQVKLSRIGYLKVLRLQRTSTAVVVLDSHYTLDRVSGLKDLRQLVLVELSSESFREKLSVFEN